MSFLRTAPSKVAAASQAGEAASARSGLFVSRRLTTAPSPPTSATPPVHAYAHAHVFSSGGAAQSARTGAAAASDRSSAPAGTETTWTSLPDAATNAPSTAATAVAASAHARAPGAGGAATT